jgi:hypothetical protein
VAIEADKNSFLFFHLQVAGKHGRADSAGFFSSNAHRGLAKQTIYKNL